MTVPAANNGRRHIASLFLPTSSPPPPLHPHVTYPSLSRANFCVLVYIFVWGGYIFERGETGEGEV